MSKMRIATTWLDGCSGCHMSLLDLDDRLADMAQQIEIVYGPLVDALEFPEAVDVALVEGAVSSDADVKKVRLIRERSKILVSFGDCAVTSNVPAMRNEFRVQEVLQRGYEENVSCHGQIPGVGVPALMPQVRPVHEYVEVDVFLPGCPPPADAIFFLLSELLQGRIPDLTGKSRFGA
ncbi:NADP oxidoreductase [Desulfoferrobacter suflitae]|uniref:NADH-quinone oxidoreductase subunit B family protein n=1 Tax=Desulfoferrobacter suflitae TaxID=2865782 RepID=UPI00216459B2|nr:NADP oxidoreductase [Desulfoferrobacter suflitae]MCK8600383.1 NADP oxidoreductase [Desulfoferrobacter suflitae]